LMLTSVTVLAGSAFGQTPVTRQDNQQKEAANSQVSSSNNSDVPPSDSLFTDYHVAIFSPRGDALSSLYNTENPSSVSLQKSLTALAESFKVRAIQQSRSVSPAVAAQRV